MDSSTNELLTAATTARMTRRAFGVSILAAAALAACSDDEATNPSSSAPTDTSETTASSGSATPTSTAGSAPTADTTAESTATPSSDAADGTGAPDFFDSSALHSIVVSFDTGVFDAMIDGFVETGDKAWLEASVDIDGTQYRQVGMRLKGNSSLAGLGSGAFPGGGQPFPAQPGDEGATDVSLPVPPGGPGGFGGIASASADEPEGLPWLIRLDKYIDDQNHEGLTEFVVRSNSSTTALNEALSIELLREAGLASQRASAVEFAVNDRPHRLRLVLENPNERWMREELGLGKLYKADASGDYSYRGDDPSSYSEAWDQEAGDDDLSPLIEFLDFINNTDDTAFVANLGDHLDVEAFTTYMAFEDLIQNTDDIAGPGNNSYLFADQTSGVMTVVAWDHNLAFSAMGVPGGTGSFDPSQLPGGTLPDGFDPSQLPGGTLPEGFDPSQIPGGTLPDGAQPPGGAGGGFGRGNVLADRYLDAPELTGRYDIALVQLRADLFESGIAQTILDRWATTLLTNATHLVDAETITSETQAIAAFLVTE